MVTIAENSDHDNQILEFVGMTVMHSRAAVLGLHMIFFIILVKKSTYFRPELHTNFESNDFRINNPKSPKRTWCCSSGSM